MPSSAHLAPKGKKLGGHQGSQPRTTPKLRSRLDTLRQAAGDCFRQYLSFSAPVFPAHSIPLISRPPLIFWIFFLSFCAGNIHSPLSLSSSSSSSSPSQTAKSDKPTNLLALLNQALLLVTHCTILNSSSVAVRLCDTFSKRHLVLQAPSIIYTSVYFRLGSCLEPHLAAEPHLNPHTTTARLGSSLILATLANRA